MKSIPSLSRANYTVNLLELKQLQLQRQHQRWPRSHLRQQHQLRRPLQPANRLIWRFYIYHIVFSCRMKKKLPQSILDPLIVSRFNLHVKKRSFTILLEIFNGLGKYQTYCTVFFNKVSVDII